MVADFKVLGYMRFIVKSDQEPAILASNEESRNSVNGGYCVRSVFCRRSQNKGEVEKAVKPVNGQMRTMKEWFGARYKA